MSNHTSTWSIGLIALGIVACSGNTLDGGSSKGSSGSSGTSGASSGSPGAGDAAGPGSSDRRLGEHCDTDAECRSGLACKQNYVADQCTTQKTCTILCKTDPECQALDPTGKCFLGCNGERICMLTR